MRRGFLQRWMMIFMLCLGTGRLFSHDLGVMTVTLEELGDSRYELRYFVVPGSPEMAGVPILPDGCGWEQEPGLPQGPMRLVFNSEGPSLRADDRIILPWKRNGVLVNAFWHNGESVRKFCALEDEGVVLRIGHLRAGGAPVDEVAERFTMLGFRHLVFGLDHVLCLIGLLVTSWRWKLMVGFGLGLGVSLMGLLMMGVKPDEKMVDALGALALVFVAAEWVRVWSGGEVRALGGTAVVSGAVQGLGFAGALQSLGLPRAELPVTAGFFLAGGWLGIGAVTLLLFGLKWSADRISLRWPERWFFSPGDALGVVAMFWVIERGVIWFA